MRGSTQGLGDQRVREGSRGLGGAGEDLRGSGRRGWPLSELSGLRGPGWLRKL